MRDQETPRKHTLPDDANEIGPKTNMPLRPRARAWTPQGIVVVGDVDNPDYSQGPNPPRAANSTRMLPLNEFLRLLASPNHLTLLVYGTLKSGYWNHDRFCRNAIDIRPATTWGRLRHLPAGYPALEVPESAILAQGTADPLADAATQDRLAVTLPPQAANQPPPGDWDLIHGELITFPDPARDLPPIDRLEGFRPGGYSMYQRVMVAVLCGRTSTPAWTYWMPRIDTGIRLGSGVWHRLC